MRGRWDADCAAVRACAAGKYALQIYLSRQIVPGMNPPGKYCRIFARSSLKPELFGHSQVDHGLEGFSIMPAWSRPARSKLEVDLQACLLMHSRHSAGKILICLPRMAYLLSIDWLSMAWQAGK